MANGWFQANILPPEAYLNLGKFAFVKNEYVPMVKNYSMVKSSIHREKARQKNIELFEKENNCTLKKKLILKFKSSFIKYLPKNAFINNNYNVYVKNEYLQIVENYSLLSTAERKNLTRQEKINEFENENNCTHLQKLVKTYGQTWIGKNLVPPDGFLKYKNYTFVKNEFISAIEEYRSENHKGSKNSGENKKFEKILVENNLRYEKEFRLTDNSRKVFSIRF